MSFGRSSRWIVACHPQPVSSCDEQPVYSCQARFANSAEPSARAQTTNAGIVSTTAWRSIGSVLRPTPCASAVMVFQGTQHWEVRSQQMFEPPVAETALLRYIL